MPTAISLSKSASFLTQWFPCFYSCTPSVHSQCNNLSNPVNNESEHISLLRILQWLRSVFQDKNQSPYNGLQKFLVTSHLSLSDFISPLLSTPPLCSTITGLLYFISILGMFPPQDLTLCVTHSSSRRPALLLDPDCSILNCFIFSLSYISPSKVPYYELICNVYHLFVFLSVCPTRLLVP